MSSATVRLVEMLDEFVSGRDRSSAHVARIESLLLEHFQDSELFEELSPAVALYAPGSGENYFDEDALAAEFRYAVGRLRQEDDTTEGE